MVASREWCSLAISIRICTRSAASRFESGSSNRKTFGARTIAPPVAAGRADEYHELLVPDVEVDALDHVDMAERLPHVPHRDVSHRCLPDAPAVTRPSRRTRRRDRAAGRYPAD